MKERAVWIDYLRSLIILMVVIHHACLAYTTYAYFNCDAYILSSHPMVDDQRWVGFDILVCFNDIFFMSLMFLISGFFVISSMKRKGARLYINDRFRRLFIPFIFSATIVAFLTYYPSYIYAHDDRNIFRFIVDFFMLEHWPAGPAWFLWVLFIFNLIFISVYPGIHALTERLGRSLFSLANKPVLLVFFWFLITWVLYVPMRFLFGPEGWTGAGPFDFQKSRFLLYLGYFILGTVVGTIPLEHGILSDKSAFIRKWPWFIVLSLSTFSLLLFVEILLKNFVQAGRISNLTSSLIYSSIFVASCVFSCAAFLTTAKAIFRQKNKFWDGVTSNAFTIYILHYTFIIWTQYILIHLKIHLMAKFLIVTLCSLLLSFLISHFLHKNRTISRYL